MSKTKITHVEVPGWNHGVTPLYEIPVVIRGFDGKPEEVEEVLLELSKIATDGEGAALQLFEVGEDKELFVAVMHKDSWSSIETFDGKDEMSFKNPPKESPNEHKVLAWCTQYVQHVKYQKSPAQRFFLFMPAKEYIEGWDEQQDHGVITYSEQYWHFS